MDNDLETQRQKKERKAPIDGGWSWMIVISGFIVFFFPISGANKSFGIFFVEFRRKFGATSQATTWIAALSRFVTLAFGPVARILSSKIGTRWVALTGGILACVGFILSMFAPNLEYLYFSYGLVVGMGASFSYSPVLTTLGQYFEKRRGMAFGLAAAGGGIGTLALPPIINLLLEEYTLPGTLLVMGGLMLHGTVAGALLRPRDFYTKSRIKQPAMQILPNNSTINGGFKGQIQDEQIISVNLETQQNRSKTDTVDNEVHSISKDILPSQPTKGYTNSGFQPGSDLNPAKLDTVAVIADKSVATVKSNGHIADGDLQIRFPIVKAFPDQAQQDLNVAKRSGNDTPVAMSGQVVVKQKKPVKDKIEWGVIRRPAVYLYGVSVFFLFGGIPLVIIFLPSFGISVGLTDTEAALLVSLMGGGDLAGRIILGVLADCNLLPKMYLYVTGGLVAAAVTVIMLHVSGNFPAIGALSFLFGAGSGNTFGLIPVIVAEEIGPVLLPSGFAIVNVFQGLPYLFAPAVAGYLNDITGRWDASFYMASGLMLVGSLVPLLLNVLRDRSSIGKKTDEVVDVTGVLESVDSTKL